MDYSGLLLVYREGGEKTRISQDHFLYIEWKKYKDYSGLPLVYRRMKIRQGLLRCTPCIKREWREEKDYSDLLLAY